MSCGWLSFKDAAEILTNSPVSCNVLISFAPQYPIPEGVEGRVAYKGTLEDTVFQMIGGIRSGMGYCGCPTIEDLKEKGQFVKISAAALRESHPHDIHITKEAPNYSIEE